MGTPPATYEERYVWSRRVKSVMITGALAVAVSVGVTLPLLPTVVLLAGGLLAVAWGVVQHRVALRVDTSGVTLGGSPLRYRSTTAVVPWSAVVAVVLWQQVLPDGSLMPCLGLQCRGGMVPPAGAARGRGGPVTGGLVPDLPADVLMASRAVNGWRMDRRRLARAVSSLAPEVWVFDHDTGEVVTGSGE